MSSYLSYFRFCLFIYTFVHGPVRSFRTQSLINCDPHYHVHQVSYTLIGYHKPAIYLTQVYN